MKRFQVRFYVPLTMTTLALWGCGEKDDAASSGSSSFATLYKELSLESNCETCHPGTAKPDFTTADTAYTSMVNVSTSTKSSACQGVLIVKPGSPELSMLTGIGIKDRYSDNFAGKSGCTPVHDKTQPDLAGLIGTAGVEKLDAWIKAGAAK